MIIQDPVTGADIEVLTADEVAAKVKAEAEAAAAKIQADLEAKHQAELEDKDRHHATKLDELMKKQKGVDNKEEELNTKLAEVTKIATEAKEQVTQAELKKNETIKNFWISQTVGTDPELTKKLQDAYDMINFEVKDETDIAKRVGLAANMMGINPIETPTVSFQGGVPPVFTPPAERQGTVDYETFKNDLGLKLPEQTKQ